MPLLTRDDFSELLAKVQQRGASYLFSKLNPSALARTQRTFDDPTLQTANWWIVPAVRARWNQRITGDPTFPYEPYVVAKYLRNRTGLSLCSLGSGSCSHELAFARHATFSQVECVDIARALLDQAKIQAQREGLHNMHFVVRDINRQHWPQNTYDVVLFHSALHHFQHVDDVLDNVWHALRPGGLVVLYDYVGPNRLQWSAAQLFAANELLATLPASYRRRYRSQRLKTRISGPGLLRMLVSDPSEAVESEQIRGAVKQRFTLLEETEVGGNLLALVLKDIAHHFLANTPQTHQLLATLFAAEDVFLTHHPSDILFGVYQKT
ncbi:class I SAM-dependent methyltransferase [Hymenobacter profundi]|uniref:Class I SAM-dependent methyltransferase n=1 Tax=Hymenobacter profundi TaxID=1982110 RepID=A0ABS6WU21_9BACT|nr:class I SAM-dependent methyltransferase [Hymenobacter profundi]MBW3126934.1 class I SAM-dependent methyltransferase [Hymenobacter profundi]MBW3127075.1 class I SAM-dependent methyltransferase [Hymenobacter profundi]